MNKLMFIISGKDKKKLSLYARSYAKRNYFSNIT